MFEDACFTVNSGERLGLVGRNGHGKTTLFRLIIGQEEPDSGSVIVPKNYSIGYLSQHVNFSKETVLEEACSVLDEDAQHEQWRVEKILSGLGFSEEDMHRSVHEFSGGYQMRIELTKVLVREPQLLLLDEPTNFLDITAIRWLESFLKKWEHEILLISHDKSFMDSVCTHIMGIHRQKIKKIAGSTNKYYEQLALEEEVYEKERLNDERKRKHMEQFITRFRAKANKASLVQSRVKALNKMGSKEELAQIETLEFSFRYADFPTKQMLSATDISFAYDEFAKIVEEFNVAVLKGERIGIIGKNGKGKTTLVRLLTGKLKPQQGEVRLHPQCKVGYFEQANTAHLDPNRTIEEELLFGHPDLPREGARSICGAMMFSGDAALKKISILSGGEKCRVLLGKILTDNVNLLVLDEPTHHLDMYSCESLIDALLAFRGASCVVTHDEYFLKAFATKLIVFQHDSINVFPGTYDEFLEQVGWQDEDAADKNQKKKPVLTKKDKSEKAALLVEKSRILKPLLKKIEEHEKTIEELEEKKACDMELMVKAAEDQDALEISRLSEDMKKVQTRLDDLYADLEKTYDKYEKEKLKLDDE